MNKTVTVNISGFVFYIEEDAYTVLSTYLNRIKAIFQSDEGGDEIINDVEARIAELFKEKLGDQKEVVTMPDVESVIQTMGKPEDYMEEGAAYNESNTNSNSQNTFKNERRKIYRDPDDKVVGGVCSGLGHYFDIDPIVLRIALVLLVIFAGTGIFIYIILWIVIPNAETTAEKLRMQGEKINVENIKKKVNDFSSSDEFKKTESGLRKAAKGFLEVFGSVLRGLGKVFQVLLAIFFSVLAVGLLIGLVALIFSTDSFMNIINSPLSINEIKELVFHGSSNFYLATTGAILLTIVPVIALIYFAVRLLAGPSYRSRSLSMTLLVLFVFGIIVATIGGTRIGTEYSAEGDSDNILTINNPDLEMLEVNMFPDDVFHSSLDWNDHRNNMELVQLESGELFNGALIYVETKSSATDNFSVRVLKESQGEKSISAAKYAENINYRVELDSNVLNLAPYFTTPAFDGFRGQEVTIQISVPDGKKVSFNKNTERICNWGFTPGKTYIYEEGYKSTYDPKKQAELETDSLKKYNM